MTPPEKTIRRESLVLRVLWMLLFLLVWQIAVPLLGILVVAQLLYRLFYGAPSSHFMNFGDSLSQYLNQIGRFAVFNTDAKPWPIADWPTARIADGEAAHIPKAKMTKEDVAPVVTPVATPASKPTETVQTSAQATEVEQAIDESEVNQTPELAEETLSATSVETEDKVATEILPADESKP